MAEFMQRTLQGIRRSVANFLLPPQCAGCETDLETTHDSISLCEACRVVFQRPLGTICPRCSVPVPAPSIGEMGCVHCAETSFRFQRLLSFGVYEGRLEQFVLRMKQQQHESLSLAVGRLLAERIREANWDPFPELVTTIPMHWSRRLRRGMNAPAVLAEAVARELNLPLALDLSFATKSVARQATLTPSRRRRNMRGVFAISSAYQLREARVLVIDDVLTTGATANAMAQALHLAGASSISFAVIARGIGSH